MVRTCIVPKCKSKCTDKGTSFHNFPKDIFFRTEWMVNLKINKDPNKYSQVCSFHFEENDFSFNMKCAQAIRRRLKENAIPTKNLPLEFAKPIKVNLPLTISNTEDICSSNEIYTIEDPCSKIERKKSSGSPLPSHSFKDNSAMPSMSQPSNSNNKVTSIFIDPLKNKTSSKLIKPFIHVISKTENEKKNLNKYKYQFDFNLGSNLNAIKCKDALVKKADGQLIPYVIRPKSMNELEDKLRALIEDNKTLLAKVENHEIEIEKLKGETLKLKFNVDNLEDNILSYYSSYKKVEFMKLLNILSQNPQLFAMDHNKQNSKEELLIFLMKLRHGFKLEDLAYRMGLNHSGVSYIFHKWVNIVNTELSQLVSFPNTISLETFEGNHNKSPRCIVGFIDLNLTSYRFCKVEKLMTESENKFKLLLALFSNGTYGFVSPLYNMSTSEKEIIKSSGFSKLLKPNYEILVDDDIGTKQLILQSGTKPIVVFSRTPTSKIGTRLKKEFYILKEKFKILKMPFPKKYLENSKNGKIAIIDKLIKICVALHNFDISSSIPNDRTHFEEYFEGSELDAINFLEDPEFSQIEEGFLSTDSLEKILQSFETNILEKADESLVRNLSLIPDQIEWFQNDT